LFLRKRRHPAPARTRHRCGRRPRMPVYARGRNTLKTVPEATGPTVLETVTLADIVSGEPWLPGGPRLVPGTADRASFLRAEPIWWRVEPGASASWSGSPSTSHTSRATRAWLAAHPRITGQWFGVLTRKMLRRGDFTSREDPGTRITAFTIRHNKRARPYKWSYDADAGHARCRGRRPRPGPQAALPEVA
jgi:hypothetical protein